MPLRAAPPLTLGAAVMLAFLAGTVDAIGFARLGGLFVSFMSGNSTRLGVFLASGDWVRVAQVSTLIVAFVSGTTLGVVMARVVGVQRRSAILMTEAVLLALAAALAAGGYNVAGTTLMAGAMGLENATFADDRGELRINVTFVTGALVKVGEGLAGALLGGARWSWVPNLLLWLGLTSGVVVGALSHARFGVATLGAVSVALALLAIGFALNDRRA